MVIKDKINAFLEMNPSPKSGKGKLKGKSLGIKANICVEGLHASCASKVLENYKCPYDAAVVSNSLC